MSTSGISEFAAYERASRRLLGLIRGGAAPSVAGGSQRDRVVARLDRTRSLLDRLDNPQRNFPVVHVTGTSGKGSVAAMIAAILTAAGYRVGLRTSPYLQAATEKLQLDGQLMDAHSLDRLSARILASCEKWGTGARIGYPEAWSALASLWLAEQEVDIAVVEVGCGGRFDCTNVFQPAVSVITNVGLDHTTSLGPTLADIAWHKAGIIKRGSIAVVGDVSAEARRVIRQEASLVQAPIVRGTTLPPTTLGSLAMSGEFQETNAGIAVAAANALRDQGFVIPESAVVAGLGAARLPGRLEQMPTYGSPSVWLDGAHNADKIAALTRESRLLAAFDARPVVVLGILRSKDVASIAAAIATFASAVVATEPSVIGRSALAASDLAAAIAMTGFSGALHVEPDPRRALGLAEALSHDSGANVVVTGSLYLVGNLRGRWYPDEAIVMQRSPWPTPSAAANQALPERSVAL